MTAFRTSEKNDVTDVVLRQWLLPVNISVTAEVVIALPAELAGTVVTRTDNVG